MSIESSKGFADAAGEAGFRHHWYVNSLWQVRTGLLLAIVMASLFGLLDTLYFSEADAAKIVVFRFFVLMPLCVALLALSFWSGFKRWLFPGAALGVIAPTLFFSALAPGMNTDGLSFFYPFLSEMALFYYVLFRMPLKLAVVGGLLQLAAGIVGISGMDGPGFHIASAIGGLVATHAMLLVASARQEFQERELYLNERELAESAERQQRALMERSSWYENLARFLRHELSNELAGIRTSVQLAQRFPDRSEEYSRRAATSIERMQNLLDITSEASSIDSALRAEESEPFALSALVEDCVLNYTDTYAKYQIVGAVEPGLVAEGQPYRVVQMLDSLMSNAVRHSSSQAPITIRLATASDAGQAKLSVTNYGDPLPEDTETLFGLWVTGALPHETQRHGLGLYVAARIAEALGGSISAQPVALDDLPGAEFVALLPLASPQLLVDQTSLEP